jgi:hypothetical protein
MGTNFYIDDPLVEPNEDAEPQLHIGKRSAAGLWCWDCNVTLCKTGISFIHHGRGYEEWHDRCPKCGKGPTEETLGSSSAGRELGFNKNPPARKAGVATCSSFTWAMTKERMLLVASMAARNTLFGDVITDEYGRHMTISQFLQVLEECPIHYHEMLGKNFS